MRDLRIMNDRAAFPISQHDRQPRIFCAFCSTYDRAYAAGRVMVRAPEQLSTMIGG